ncbi:MAG: Protein of unknown function DUF1428, partial [uncultured Chthoniobacterales bacterium]
AERERRRLQADGGERLQDMARTRRARLPRVHRRRHRREVRPLIRRRYQRQARGNGRLRLDHLPVAGASRRGEREGDERPAHRRRHGEQGDAVRLQAHALRRLRDTCGEL